MLGPLLLLALLVTVPWSGLRDLIEALPTWLGAYSEVHIWGVPALETSSQSLAAFVGAVTLSVPIFTLIALILLWRRLQGRPIYQAILSHSPLKSAD